MERIRQWVSFLRDLGILVGIPYLYMVGSNLYELQINTLDKEVILLERQIKVLEGQAYDKTSSLIKGQENVLKQKYEINQFQLATALTKAMGQNTLGQKSLEELIPQVEKELKKEQKKTNDKMANYFAEKEKLLNAEKEIKILTSKLDEQADYISQLEEQFDLTDEVETKNKTRFLSVEMIVEKGKLLDEISLINYRNISKITKKCSSAKNGFRNCYEVSRMDFYEKIVKLIKSDQKTFKKGDEYKCMFVDMFKDINLTLERECTY